MSDHVAWYIARGSGVVTWGLLVASMIWGLLYATRLFRRRVSLWWLLGVHRFLGALAIVFTAVHVTAMLLDNFVGFQLTDALIPFTSTWHPIAVGWGIIAMYLLVAIEATSLLKSRLPYGWWRNVHLASYPLFALATVHSLSAGTDTKASIGDGLASAVGAVAIALALVGLDRRAAADPRRPTSPTDAPLQNAPWIR